ncbi:MAG: rhomboid family intramembrane serine protease [Myxococcota bacterium]
MLFHVQLDGIDRTVALADFEDLVRAGEIGPETPVRPVPRGAPADAGAWVAAGTLPSFREVVRGPQMAVRRAWIDPPVPWMTALIVGICVRTYLWVQPGEAGRAITLKMTKWAPAILEKGETWRLLTCALLHADLTHLLMNMIFLAWVGAALESLIGWAGVGALFLVTVFGGSALSGAFSNEPSVGASGADFGYLAAAAVIGWRFHDLMPARARPRFGTAMVVYIAWSLVTGAFNERIDNLAHVGGVLAGTAFAAAIRPAAVQAWRAWNRGVVGATLAVVFAGTLAAGWIPAPMAPVEADGVTAVRPESWREGTTPSGDFGWVSPLDHATVVVRTLKGREPADAGAVADGFLAAWRDAGTLAGEARTSRADGLAFDATAADRRIEGRVIVRGVYAHLVAVTWEADNPRLARLAGRVLDAVALAPTKAQRDVEGAGDGVLARVARARVAADHGDVDGALALLAAAKASDPGGRGPVVAELEIATRWERPGLDALAEAALARHPDDAAVVEAAADALLAAGARERALGAVDAALARKPESRRLARLRERLSQAP